MIPFAANATVTLQRRLSMLLNGPENPLKLSLLLGNLHAHLIHCSMGPPKSSSKTACRSVQQFCTAHCSVLLLHNGPLHFPQKLPLPHGDQVPQVTHIPRAHSSQQTASGSVQPFSYGSQNCPFHVRHPAGGQSHGNRQHAQKFGKDRACGSGDMLADRQTDTDKETDRHTDMLIIILCHRSCGRNNNNENLISQWQVGIAIKA